MSIKRAGDVIPFVIGPVDPALRDGSEQLIEPPDRCPSCGGPLVEVGESRVLQCENVQGCPAQLLRRLVHWASRAAADIDAIGVGWIERLVEAQLLTRPSDFYALERERLLEFERIGERLADKMLASIDRSRGVGLRKALVGFAIPLCSDGTARRLTRAGYESVEQIAAASADVLERVEDIGPIVAEALSTFFAQPASREEVAALRARGVSLDVRDEDRPVATPDATPFAGKTVVLTGTIMEHVFQNALRGS